MQAVHAGSGRSRADPMILLLERHPFSYEGPARCAERLRTGEKTEVLSFGGRVALAGSTVRPTEALGRGRTTEKPR
jgi:hypothetical protein